MSEVMTVQETFTRLNKQFGNINIKQLSELSPVKDDIVSTGIDRKSVCRERVSAVV